MVKCLYVKSSVCVNLNGVLTDSLEVQRGGKQGCPLSPALYILAINPLIKKINSDTAMAYADDITVVIKNQREMDALINILSVYELASGAKLNHSKTEGVWKGEESDRGDINIQIKQEIKLLGLTICNKDCAEVNWEKKLSEVKEEVKKMGKQKN